LILKDRTMQFTETLNDGLKRSYVVTIFAKDMAAKLDSEIAKIAPQVRMPGFRQGKVPLNLVKKMHGKALTNDVLQAAISDSAQELLTKNNLRPALQPKVELIKYDEAADLEFSVSLEILPEVPAASFDGLTLEKLVVPVSDAAVTESLEKLAAQQKSFDAAPKAHKAANGDAVMINFLGKLDGVPFEGGAGSDVQLDLGSGMFIPGFEEQLVGATAGDARVVNVSFPDNYPAENLKGKAVVFDVTVTEVKIAKPVEINEELATNLGLESLDKLKELLKAQIEREYAGLTRTHLKRKLLDALAAQHSFEVPQGMVDAEFEQIWKQLEAEVGDDLSAKAELDAERGDYVAIAERRVRLGLLLSDIGQKANVQITAQEMQRLVQQEAMRYPDQQKEVIKFFSENQMAAAQLRAPLYEEKVVDHILGVITTTEREVTREEVEAAIQEEETTSSAPAAEKPAKKAAKPKAEAAADDDVEKPAKKPAAKKATKKAE
jgi:trigger factor